jgi:hypothetical protein
MTSNLNSCDNFPKYIPAELEDMSRVANTFSLNLVSLPEWLPFFYPNESAFSVSRELYGEVAKIHKVQVDRLIARTRPVAMYVPPLTSIVLQRCKTREDLPEAIWKTREDFTPYRVAANTLTTRIANGQTFKDQIDALDEHEATVKALSAKITKPRTRILQTVWDIVKEGDLKKMALKALDKLFKTNLEHRRFRMVSGYYDLYSAALCGRDYWTQIEKIFGPIDAGRNDLSVNSFGLLEEIACPIRTEGSLDQS